jgi:hypothetical protein
MKSGKPIDRGYSSSVFLIMVEVVIIIGRDCLALFQVIMKVFFFEFQKTKAIIFQPTKLLSLFSVSVVSYKCSFCFVSVTL